MPSIDINFLKLIKDEDILKNFPNFVETGTLNGETIFEMEKYFQNLYTVEISEKYYLKTKKCYYGNKINFLLGDSSKVFEKLLPNLNDNTIFFLDGHWSSGDTGRGDKDVPLIEEIQKINTFFTKKGIIIIDDARLFGKGPNSGVNENWEDISSEKIITILKNRIEMIYFLPSQLNFQDRLIIHIKDIN